MKEWTKNHHKIFIILGIVALILTINVAKADSGWDVGYDSGGSWGGGSWSSGSSHDYGSHHDYGSSYSSDDSYPISPLDRIMDILQIVIILSIYLTCMFKLLRKSEPTRSKIEIRPIPPKIYHEVSDEVFEKYNINKDELKQMVFDKYVDIQNGWMNFDYDNLRNLLTDELYNSYKMQLEALSLKKQKNIMADYKLLDIKIVNIKNENNIINVDAYLKISMYDYVIDFEEKVVRGQKDQKVEVTYLITFVKTIKDANVIKCPNCGAELDAIVGGTCSYCRSVIVGDAKDYVMSKKTCINQRRLK